MKALKLTIHNIGILEDVAIEINKPELVFYGEVMQGKTTILNAVRWVLGGAFPADILRHGTTEAFVQYEGLENDGKPFVIRREWYVGEDGSTKARPLIYTRAGLPVPKPVQALQAHINPFLLDQDHLRNMGATERWRYLVQLFGVDTCQEDQGIEAAKSTATQLRAKIAGYGIIDLTPVERVDVAALREQLAASQAEDAAILQAKHDARAKVDEADRTVKAVHDEIAAAEQSIQVAGATIRNIESQINAVEQQIAELQRQLTAQKSQLTQAQEDEKRRQAFREELSFQKLPAAQAARTAAAGAWQIAESAPFKDQGPLLQALEKAGQQNARAEAFEKAKIQAAACDADKQRLREQEAAIDQLKQKKIEKLTAIGAATGIPGLVFTEEGFTFEGAAHDMISDSQMMRLSNLLSAKYPEGLGISLIDRGESLGKSVLLLHRDAQARSATVFVTVVGDKPAVVPDEVGAFVVENGKVS